MRVGDMVEVIDGTGNGSGYLGERARIVDMDAERYSILWLDARLNPSSTVGWRVNEFKRYMRVVKKPIIIIGI